MSNILVFMPWYNIVDKTVVGTFTLYPFDFSLSNNDPDIKPFENDIKCILSNYVDISFTPGARREFPTKNATILKKRGKEIGEEVTEKEIAEIYILQYVLACCGISNREFIDSSRYLCSDNLKIVVQKFQSPLTSAFAPSITSKRKKGFDVIGFSPALFREVKSWSIPTQNIPGNVDYRLKFDPELAEALWKSWKLPAYQRFWSNQIYPSLFSFYHANTDGFLDPTECFYSAACIEKLLLGNKYKEADLLVAFRLLIKDSAIPFEEFTGSVNRNWKVIKVPERRIVRKLPFWLVPKFFEKIKKIKKVLYKDFSVDVSLPNILEAWLIEHKRLRNIFAHGGFSVPNSNVWTLKEHLLFSAFLYPLLLKLFLINRVKISGYVLTGIETNKIRVLEQMLNASKLDKVDVFADTEWEQIIKDSRWL